MINLSIMPLNTARIDEICDDIVQQQRTGVSTHALFFMTFNAEGTPAADKATEQCEKYDMFRQRLDSLGAKHGVLVQSTVGHIVVPNSPHPFQCAVYLETGEERVVNCCPLDPNFRRHMRNQFKILAEHKPSFVMIDDDMGLIYRPTKGCACKYHMAEFNRRAGTNMTREQLYLHTQGDSDEDKRYTDIYISVQRDGLVGLAEAMRAGLDEVDPTIQGAVSGIYTTSFCEFSADTAKAFAGRGNPRIVRLNGGAYSNSARAGGGRFFTNWMFRASLLRECTKDVVDIYLAETDACPHNRYSTSATQLHAHFVGSILEGAGGAKHWITRLGAFEPASGRAYRKRLAKFCGFYESLEKYAKQLKPFGCRIPVTLTQNYQLKPTELGDNLTAWGACVLERMGLPLYFSNYENGAVFLDDFTVDGFNDEEVKKFLKGTLILSAVAAKKLENRGFADLVGVTVDEWRGDVISNEDLNGNNIAKQYNSKMLTPINESVEALSYAVHKNPHTLELTNLFPAVTRYKNSLGGTCVVFSGTPDTPFLYFTAFSMLNETRKAQLVKILSECGHLPIYYPEDAEIYLRAGYLPSGEIFAAVFNLSHDVLDELVLVVSSQGVSSVEKLNERGERVPCEFEFEDGRLIVKENVYSLEPLILFIK